jgi:hypothetical protein
MWKNENNKEKNKTLGGWKFSNVIDKIWPLAQ